jgi:hypothetical protein
MKPKLICSECGTTVLGDTNVCDEDEGVFFCPECKTYVEVEEVFEKMYHKRFSRYELNQIREMQ